MRSVDIITLQQFEAAGGLADSYSFEDFECPLNAEVEDFLKKKAMQSSRLGASTTYLVFDSETSDLLGYFTLLLKPFSIREDMLSNTKRRLIERFAEEDIERGVYTAAVYLIAQIGKNFGLPKNQRIDGDLLISLAFEKLYAARELVGGKLVLVERDKTSQKLYDFYTRNGFHSWNVRRDNSDGITYDQMLCVLNTAK